MNLDCKGEKMMPNCPKCTSILFETEVLRDCDVTEPALACSNELCDFLVSDSLGEFLYDDC